MAAPPVRSAAAETTNEAVAERVCEMADERFMLNGIIDTLGRELYNFYLKLIDQFQPEIITFETVKLIRGRDVGVIVVLKVVRVDGGSAASRRETYHFSMIAQ